MIIDKNNYEDYLIKKLEGLLSRDELAELNLFLQRHPEVQAEWHALEQTVLVADESVVFEHKQSLKKPEGGRVIPLFGMLRISSAVAAAVLVFVFIFYFKPGGNDGKVVAINTTPVNSSVAPVNPEATAPGTSSAPDASSANTVIVNPPSPGKQYASILTYPSKPYSYKPYNMQPVHVTSDESDAYPANPSVNPPVELVALTDAPLNAVPLREKSHSRHSTSYTPPSYSALQPTGNAPEKTSWLQIVSAVGQRLYHLSGRGDDMPSKDNPTITLSGKKFSLLNAFHIIHSHSTNQPK